ncbi:MAG: right-handed parallel beta-helix repeat-containing protein [Ignavibacteriales bacterium]|nr:right-handed parallel beta-helix repeat-containing protein [Ignavibacteriales bacterium]
MKIINTIKICFAVLIIMFSTNTSYATNTNKSFNFNGATSSLKILDGASVNGDANQSGFKYFNSTTSSSNKKITVDTWVYLIGDNPGAVMPIITRSVAGGSTFSMYVKDGTAFFSVGNCVPVSTANSFPSFPAFSWIRLTGTYDGSTLKIYYNNTLAESRSQSLGPVYTSGEGLFIGKYGDDAFNGLIDEIRIFNTALSSSQINSCNGGGDPSSSIPSSLVSYLVGRWSFTEKYTYGNTVVLKDLSSKKNHLILTDIDEIVQSNPLPFFVVNSSLDLPDLNPGNGIADAGDGKVTLRSAIQEANALSGLQKIYFYNTSLVPFIISPTSNLPQVSGSVILDGTFQRGYNGLALIEVQGSYGGLIISCGESTVKGLVLNNSSGFGLTLSNSGQNNISANQISGILISSQGNNINNNKITGSAGDGISITNGGINNQIGILSSNNIIGNTGSGISVVGANGNAISNNVIKNNGSGILLSNSTGSVSLNTVSENTGIGIIINGANGNTLTGNTINYNLNGGLTLNGNNNTFNNNSFLITQG